MNPAIKEKWVNALRSGKYKQARNTLRNKKGFCCLGVLCDIYLKEKKKKWDIAGKGLSYYGSKAFDDGQTTLLPEKVVKWSGLDSDNPSLLGDMRASTLNDARKYPFEIISDLIEANL